MDETYKIAITRLGDRMETTSLFTVSERPQSSRKPALTSTD
jgi:hypothetical protein